MAVRRLAQEIGPSVSCSSTPQNAVPNTDLTSMSLPMSSNSERHPKMPSLLRNEPQKGVMVHDQARGQPRTREPDVVEKGEVDFPHGIQSFKDGSCLVLHLAARYVFDCENDCKKETT